jgi:hypothetical protein
MATSYDLSDLGGTEIHDLSDLGGTPVIEEAPELRGNPSLPLRLTGDVAAGLASAGQGVHNFLARALTPIMGQYAPAQTNIDFSKTFGVNQPNVGDQLLQGYAQTIPYAPIGAESAAGRILSGALFGGTQADDPVKGAGEAGGLTAAVEAIPGVGKLAGKAFEAISPQKHAQQMLDSLGSGKSLEENAKSLARAIQDSYKNKMAEGGALYQPVFDKVGDTKLYDVITDPANSSYKNLSEDITKNYDIDLKDLHNNFVKNPTFNNAHELRSQLSSTIRQLSKNPAPEQATRNEIKAYQRAKNALDTDMDLFLSQATPDLASQYKAANTYWATNVAPYRENSRIAKIASGDITNPKNIANIFSAPEPETLQIVNDLGGGAAHKILYAELGKNKGKLTPEKLANAIGNLDKQGLSSYVTPEFEKQADTLANKIKLRNGAGLVASGLAGGGVGHAIGIPYGETLGATIGAGLSPLLNTLSGKIPSNSATAQQIARAISAGYRPLSKAIIANTINGEK